LTDKNAGRAFDEQLDRPVLMTIIRVVVTESDDGCNRA
jgi:hypothetical protein